MRSAILRVLGALLVSAMVLPAVAGCGGKQSLPSPRRDTTSEEAEEGEESEESESAGTKEDSSSKRSTPPTSTDPTVPAAPAAPAPPAAETPKVPAPAMKDKLEANQQLAAGEKLSSPNGAAMAVYQEDGNFVVYGPGGALFDTKTSGTTVGQVIMQDDGNLVLYSDGAPLFDSRTHGNPGAFAVIQDDCNLVVYSAGGDALWASGALCN
jgi:hypothetical protein